MLRLIGVMLTILVSSGYPFEIRAEVMSVAGRQVDVKLPPGYCAAKVSGREAGIVERVQQSVRPHNQLILMFVNCDDLLPKRLNRHIEEGGFEDYGTLLLLTPNGQQATSEMNSRTSFLAETMNTVATAPNLSSVTEKYVKAAEKRLQELRPGSLQNLGIIDKDENAIYTGMVYTAHDLNGVEKRYIIVGGYTLVKNLKMTMNTFRQYKSAADLRTTLAASKASLARFVSAND